MIFLTQTDDKNQISTYFGYSIYQAFLKEQWMNSNLKSDSFLLMSLEEMKHFFYSIEEDRLDEIIPIGSIEFVENWTKMAYNKEITKYESFSDSIYHLLGFKISRLDDIDKFPIFVKPYKNIKRFTGDVLTKVADINSLIQMYDLPSDIKIMQRAEITGILAEFRVFIFEYSWETEIVFYRIDDNRDLKIKMDAVKTKVDKFLMIMKDYSKKSINHISMDFVITDREEIIPIEIHDGWSLGDYGLECTKYKKFVMGSWKRIIGDLK